MTEYEVDLDHNTMDHVFLLFVGVIAETGQVHTNCLLRKVEISHSISSYRQNMFS